MRRLSLAVLAVALLASGCTDDSAAGDPSSQVRRPAPVTGPFLVSHAYRVTFAPSSEGPPTDAAATFTAFSGKAAMPDGVTPQYGTLTAQSNAIDDPHPTFLVKDRPVWAYTSYGCMISNGPVTTPSTKMPSQCIKWRFLDPESGKHIMDVQQD